MRFTYSSLTIGRSAFLPWLTPTRRIPLNPLMELMRVSQTDQDAMQHVAHPRCDADPARAHAHAYPRFRTGALRRRRTCGIERSSIAHVKQRFLRTSRILYGDKFNFRHRAFLTDAQQNRRPSIRYIQHASCNGNDADPWKRFCGAKKGPDLRRGLSISRKIISKHQNIPIRT